MAERIKIAVAALVAIGAFVAFYMLADRVTVVRLGALLGGLAVAVVILWFTEAGRQFVAFSREAWDEAKRVVWPTRKESLQTAGIVFAFVLVMAVFLWVSDKTLEYLLYDLILGWKKL